MEELVSGFINFSVLYFIDICPALYYFLSLVLSLVCLIANFLNSFLILFL